MTMNRTETIRLRLAALELELAERALYGDDRFEDGTVLVFDADFGLVGGTTYSYAVIKANGVWHVTGRETTRFSWDGLVDFFKRTNVTVDNIRVVTKTKRLDRYI